MSRQQRRSQVPEPVALPTAPQTEPLLMRTDQSRFRATKTLQRVAYMLKRRMGHEREDKHFDKLLRDKVVAITGFSMVGLLTSLFIDAIPFREGNTPREEGPTILEQFDNKLLLLSLQTILTSTTIITIALICQYYRLHLLLKRKEWSGIDLPQASHAAESAAEREMRKREEAVLKDAFSFWASFWMTLAFVSEVAVHMLHPMVFMSNFTGLYEVTKITCLLRLYHFARLYHLFSSSYRDRFEIVNQYEEFQAMSLKITPEFTMKTLMSRHVSSALGMWSVMTIIVGGFGMFLVERDAQSDESWAPGTIDWAGDLLNACWFAFVTASTIGYGDYWPVTFRGRIVAVLIGLNGFFLVTVFTAELVNALKPSKTERYINGYLAARKADVIYEHSAAKLIQCIWRTKKAQKFEYGRRRHFHRSNVILDAVKDLQSLRRSIGDRGSDGALDIVLDDALDQLTHQANDLGLLVQAQRDELISMHKRVLRQLKLIKDKVATATGKDAAPARPTYNHVPDFVSNNIPFYD